MLDPTHPIAELLARDDRYPFDAYVFVFEALRFSQEKLGMGTEYLAEDYGTEGARDLDHDSDSDVDDGDGEPERHVSGQELCEAMRQYAHQQYGYLAKNVLNHWAIYSTGDFGEIVFNLIKIESYISWRTIIFYYICKFE